MCYIDPPRFPNPYIAPMFPDPYDWARPTFPYMPTRDYRDERIDQLEAEIARLRDIIDRIKYPSNKPWRQLISTTPNIAMMSIS